MASTTNGCSPTASGLAETTARVDSVRVSAVTTTTTTNPTTPAEKEEEEGSNHGTKLDPAQLIAVQGRLCLLLFKCQ